MSTSAAVESDAASLQADGNAAFAAGASEEAQRFYSSALELRPDDATLLSNRAAALLCALTSRVGPWNQELATTRRATPWPPPRRCRRASPL